MSTRVHELAKELGLKSQELLDRIQKWGLDVKSSALASLDPGTADRIRQLMQGSKSSGPSVRPSAPSPKETPAISPTATASRSTGHGPSASPTHPAAAEPAAGSPSPSPAAPPAAPTPTPTPPAPQATASAAPPSAAPPAPNRSLSSPPSAGPPQSARPGLGAPRPGSAPPRGPQGPSGGPSRPSGPLSRQAGPLSGHTPHHRERGPAPGPGGRVQGPASQQAPSEPRSQSGGPAPLKRSDYISPSGTRQNLSQRPGAGGPRPNQGQGQGPGQGGDGSRRDAPPAARPGSGRPLPQVAAPTGQSAPPRRPEGPRPGPEAKTQRPDVKFTPAQLREMMMAGKLGGGPGAGPLAPTKPGAGPAARSGAGPNARGPAAPAMRRPPTGSTGPAPTVEEEDDRKKGAGGAGRLGTAADRAGRRAKRNERAMERRVSSPVPASALMEGEEEGRRTRGPSRKHKGGGRTALAPSRKSHAEIEFPITVRSLSEATGIPAKNLIGKMFALNQPVTINSNLDDETAMMLAMEFGVELEVVHERTAEDDLLEAFEPEERPEDLKPRPPVITILGHVDHGKTSLLDKVRQANVVDTETGGITQHIGAYQIDHGDRKIAFVDTPGHEAFTAMRARGANVTDIVVLVVAADDGVMPQTIEAIAHAKAAEVPVVVALNKIDLPNVESTANINKIYGELSQQGLNPTEWGGDTEVIRTSTLTGRGLDDLLSTLETLAELLELKANPDRAATGTCLESSISEGRGVVATVLVQEGTLKVGDVLVCGDGYGRVRALFDDKGRSISEAGPSTPVEVSGLDVVPTAGEKFAVIDDITRAREVVEARRERSRGAALGERQTVTLENLYDRMAEQKVKSLNLVLKADVQGSLEALIKELEKLENDEVPIKVLMKAVGGISESDILLADASQAIVIGFRVAPEDRAHTLAEEKKIDIRRYDIIYQVTDEIKKAVEGMLVPEVKESHLGRAVVRQVFKISKVGTVAGCFVTQGLMERGARTRIIREGREIYKGQIDALKRFKDDVKEVAQNFECGIKVSNFDDIKVDDVIEAYRIEVIRRTL